MTDFTPGINLGITHALTSLLTGRSLDPSPSQLNANPAAQLAAATTKNAQNVAATSQAGATNGGSSGAYGGGSAAADEAKATASTIAGLDSQATNLNSLLGRTDTGLDQGLSALNDSYTSNVNSQQSQENQALQDYADQRVTTNKDKLGAYDTINKNANNGYRSLSQIIGRSAGTGSSAFQELLPDVIGKETSSKRSDANGVYAENLGNIDTAQKKTQNSFAQILEDLANQRQSQEKALRTGVETQKQTLQSQLQQNAEDRAKAAGGGAAEVAAASAPAQAAIENSRNAVENFFNQFKPTVTAQQAAIAAPDLSQYTVDRANVNATGQGVADPTNPYADILRKKLQEQVA